MNIDKILFSSQKLLDFIIKEENKSATIVKSQSKADGNNKKSL